VKNGKENEIRHDLLDANHTTLIRCNKKVRHLELRIEELKEIIRILKDRPQGLEDYKETTIRKIRRQFPVESAKYTDLDIARAYSCYCETNHAAGWTDTDIGLFGRWAFKGTRRAIDEFVRYGD